jgi:hypothetical protein
MGSARRNSKRNLQTAMFGTEQISSATASASTLELGILELGIVIKKQSGRANDIH